MSLSDPTVDIPRASVAPAAAVAEAALAAPVPGVGLCLSGGGFRAMLYHAGAVVRLQETGILAQVKRISSVSGGSIAAGRLAVVLAKSGKPLGSISREDLLRDFVEPLVGLAGRTVDIPSILLGMLPFLNVGREVACRLDRWLIGSMRIDEIPDFPRFVFNSSSLQSGDLWRFSKPYMADWKVGQFMEPRIPLSWAVAASASFPPFLSPFRLRLESRHYTKSSLGPLGRPPYTTRPVLSDGGVYDNLGLETVFKRYTSVLVSDGGAPFGEVPRVMAFWPVQLLRAVGCIQNQVGALRKRQLLGAYTGGDRTGAYWGIATPLASYPKPGNLPCPPAETAALAAVPTRLASMDIGLRRRLVNWGYVSAAASLGSHFSGQGAPPAPLWPYPDAPLG